MMHEWKEWSEWARIQKKRDSSLCVGMTRKVCEVTHPPQGCLAMTARPLGMGED